MLSLFEKLGKPWLKGLFIAAIFKLYWDVNFNDTIDTSVLIWCCMNSATERL